MAAAMLEMRPFLFRDPPDHTRLRGLVSKAFTPKVVESLRGRTQEVVDELLDAAIEAGVVDLMEDFASPCQSGSSAISSVYRSRIRIVSRSGRMRWHEASIPIFSLPQKSSRRGTKV